LNAATQLAANLMRCRLNLAEVNRLASPPFGCLKLRGRLRSLAQQSLQFLLQNLHLAIHGLHSYRLKILPGQNYPTQFTR
jgi:hypothetical protein